MESPNSEPLSVHPAPPSEPAPNQSVSTPSAAARIPSPLQALFIWLTAAVALIVAGLGVAAVAAAWVVADGKDPLKVLGDPATSPLVSSPGWIAWGTIANEVAVFGSLLFWLWVLKTPRRIALPLGRPSVLGVLGALLLVFGLAPVAEIMGELMHRLTSNEITASKVVVNAARSASGSGVVLLVFALGVMPAVVEEALFRGLLTAPFERRFALGLIVPSILFGLFHLEPTQIAGTIVLGVAFAAARLCTGTLSTSMIAHLVYNTTVVLTVRYSTALTERELDVVPMLVGLALAVAGSLLLWRERRVLVASFAGTREPMPSWWI
ncbi:MAG: CPBP family intramembrane metalloprotease [Myxococcales bacterium]|nr:CPBP family intramembrane metalloprotease [Myxococcales bacterium]